MIFFGAFYVYSYWNKNPKSWNHHFLTRENKDDIFECTVESKISIVSLWLFMLKQKRPQNHDDMHLLIESIIKSIAQVWLCPTIFMLKNKKPDDNSIYSRLFHN